MASSQKPSVVWQFYIWFVILFLILIDRHFMFISFSVVMSRCASFIKISAWVPEVSNIFTLPVALRSREINSRFPI